MRTLPAALANIQNTGKIFSCLKKIKEFKFLHFCRKFLSNNWNNLAALNEVKSRKKNRLDCSLNDIQWLYTSNASLTYYYYYSNTCIPVLLNLNHSCPKSHSHSFIVRRRRRQLTKERKLKMLMKILMNNWKNVYLLRRPKPPNNYWIGS